MKNKTLLWVWSGVETLGYPYLCTESLRLQWVPLGTTNQLHFGGQSHTVQGTVDMSLGCV